MAPPARVVLPSAPRAELFGKGEMGSALLFVSDVTCLFKDVSQETPDVAPCHTSPPLPFVVHISCETPDVTPCHTSPPQGVWCGMHDAPTTDARLLPKVHASGISRIWFLPFYGSNAARVWRQAPLCNLVLRRPRSWACTLSGASWKYSVICIMICNSIQSIIRSTEYYQGRGRVLWVVHPLGLRSGA